MSQQEERYLQALLSHRQISRRGLFRGLFNGSKQAYQQSLPQTPPRQFPRPPQALQEDLFVHLCNECGNCINACPYSLTTLGENKVSLNIDFCSCDMCGKCTESCPTQALHASIIPDTGLRPSISSLCLKQRGMHCQLCEPYCPQNALLFAPAQGKLHHSDRCNGCGECKVRCHYGYIQLNLDP